jgi:DNA-binding HxlR family transcriptional regulator
MLNRDYEGQNCSIARALGVVGERWTLLIIRDVLRGLRRFDQLQESLGIARKLLTDRLNRLVDEGVLERVLYSERPERYEYKLTKKGLDLNIALTALRQWGVTNVLAEAGTIDVLVNNAGIASVGVREAFTTDQAKVIFDTKVIGLLRVTRAVLPSMRQERDGLIINMGSILGRVTFHFLGIYGASKFAVEALTDSLRYEVSQLGVEVVAVQPSGYPTNFFASIQTPAGTEVTESDGEVGQIPDAMFKTFMSRFEGEDAPNPHDVAEAVATLVGQSKGSRAARTVVGEAFGADKANEDIAPVQAQAVEALGLGHLERVA